VSVALVAWASAFAGAVSLSAASGQELDFNRDIRPILSNHCFRCHGPDEAERAGGGESGLRLDTPVGQREDLGGYAAIVPGHPETSELLMRVLSDDPSLVMPPPEAGPRLSDDEVDRLRRWIAAGAPFAQHWAYVPPQKPAVPEVADDFGRDWAQNPIDHFVLERLAREGLQPQPMADRHALIRRVALDLTGLPPTAAEVQAYVADTGPDSYATMVDHFLAKESYGEHWARMWLDLARYADSAGYADDPPRTIWAYRDYVIRAYNQNLPFDRFTIEQLAGDLLPDATPDQRVATAFHRNTMTNNEGGTNDEEFRNVAVVDRVNTTYAVWMGTTMACAQCHTHKYDPLTHAEYFQSFALFNQSEDADRGNEAPLLEVWSPTAQARRDALLADLSRVEGDYRQWTPALEAALTEWEARLPQQPQWHAAPVVSVRSAGDIGLSFDAATGIVRSGQAAAQDTFEIELDVTELAETGTGQLAAIQLQALADPSLPGGGPGWSGGNFVLSEVRATLRPAQPLAPAGRFVRVTLPGANRILSLAEIQVFSGDQNVAPLGQASQSSTSHEGQAARAIDGNTDGEYFRSNSVTHSADRSTDPWWEVALAADTTVERVVVWNRTDGGAAIASRLQGAIVQLLDEQRQIVWQGTLDDPTRPEVTFVLDGSRPLNFAAAVADFNQDGFPATSLLAKPIDLQKGWAVGGAAGRDHQLTLVLAESVAVPAGSRLHMSLVQQSPHVQHLLGKFRLQVTGDPSISAWAAVPPQLQGFVALGAAGRSPEQQAAVVEHFRSVTPLLAETRQQLQALRSELSGLKPTTTVPVMQERQPEQHRETRIHLRGNYLDLGEEVSVGIPAVFAAPGTEVRDRLDLALWLVSRQNPLTARVTVNRYWEQIFGTGLVATSEEFGSQGDLPSHPELLDYLAVEFMDSGWDMKQLLRTLLLSATYRQDSRVSRDLAQRDPDNRLLARGPRFRLPAETIRDQALAVAGLLSSKMYGPPVKPPQPALGLAAAFGSSTDWQTSSGEDRYRRGMYTTWRRSNPYPSMATFDAPNREVCALRRTRTNTPLQALVTLNDPVYIEAAQALARKVLAQPGELDERLEAALTAALVRPIDAEEVAVLRRLFEKASEALREQPEQALALATEPIGPAPDGSDLVELAAWTVVANAILNLDEFLMRR
jgi:mono/diheme cytochrome c family protein